MAGKTMSGRIRLNYFLYALLLTGVLLYVRFPSAEVQEYLGGKIAAIIPSTDIQAGDFRYVFPTTIRFDRVVIQAADGGDELALVENLAVSPVMAGLGLKYSLSGDLYGGTFRCGLKLSPMAGKFIMEDMDIAGLDLGRTNFVQRLFQREIEGALDFNGTVAGDLSGKGVGRFEGEVVIRDGGFPLRQPILLVTRMDFQELAAKVSFENELLNLLDGSLKGEKFHAEYAGKLRTANNPETWQLELSGSLMPRQEYTGANPQVLRVVNRLQKQFRKNDLPFRVNGSIVNPRFRFENQ